MIGKKFPDEVHVRALLDYANSIIATLRDPFLVLDKNLSVVSANQAFYSTFRVIEKDTIGRVLTDLGNKQWNIPKLIYLLKEIIPEKKFFNDYEVEYKLEGIGQHIMILNARQINIPEDLVTRVARDKIASELILLAFEDITERKRLQEELIASEDRYRRAFETSRDGLLLVHKTEGSILNSNVSVQELLGYSSEEFLRMNLWGIGVTKDKNDFHEMVSKIEKDAVIHYEDIPVVTKIGSSINAEVFLVNKAKVLQCNIRNITERKEAEEVLKESEEKFKAIFNESTDGMILADIETKRFLMCNPKICEMLGYKEEEMFNMMIGNIHPGENLAYVLEQFERQAKGEIKLAASLPIKRKDGSIFYADVNASPITIAGKNYLLGSFRDITERKKMEDDLREKMNDLERFSKFAVDRELKMEELEKKIKELEKKFGTAN